MNYQDSEHVKPPLVAAAGRSQATGRNLDQGTGADKSTARQCYLRVSTGQTGAGRSHGAEHEAGRFGEVVEAEATSLDGRRWHARRSGSRTCTGQARVGALRSGVEREARDHESAPGLSDVIAETREVATRAREDARRRAQDASTTRRTVMPEENGDSDVLPSFGLRVA